MLTDWLLVCPKLCSYSHLWSFLEESKKSIFIALLKLLDWSPRIINLLVKGFAPSSLLVALHLPNYLVDLQTPQHFALRISGNGLTRPSYLYENHLTDKRVFQLGDSLYKGIEQSEGFAGELDMNGLGMQMVNHIIADKEANKAGSSAEVKDAVSACHVGEYKEPTCRKILQICR